MVADASGKAISKRGARRNQQLETYFRHAIHERYKSTISSITLDTSSIEAYKRTTSSLRTRLLDTIPHWNDRPREATAKVDDLGDLDSSRLYRLQVSVIDDVRMPCLMLIPKESKRNPRPAVLCLHGYEGSPESAIGLSVPDYMNASGRRLAAEGYVVIAPHLVCSPPGFGKDRVRLDRLARLADFSLLGFEILELSRVIDYAHKCQEILHSRIGAYGISQGGQNALLLAALDTRVAATVVSGYLNNRWNKMLETKYFTKASKKEHLPYVDYLSTEEDDKFNPLGMPLIPDRLLGALVCPRPLMVEIGRDDPIVYWRDAVDEFEQIARIYKTLGYANRARASVMKSRGHEMFFDDAKEFLDSWLLKPTSVK